MNRLRSTWRTAKILIVATLYSVVTHDVVLAAQSAAADDGEDKGYSSWVMAYILVLLAVVLGLLVVLRSAKRRDRAKPEIYGAAERQSVKQSLED